MKFPYEGVIFDWAWTLLDLGPEDDRPAFFAMAEFLETRGHSLGNPEHAYTASSTLFREQILTSRGCGLEAPYEMILNYMGMERGWDLREADKKEALSVYYKTIYSQRKLYEDTVPVLDAMQKALQGEVDVIVGIESRGFIFGAALADRLGVAFVPARKPGKLPAESLRAEYELEYGTDALEIHRDAITKGLSVAIVDDLLATGGTAAATCRLVEELGGVLHCYLFLIELSFLNGREKLKGHRVESLIQYAGE